MEVQPASIQFVSPPSTKFHSPTKRDMARSAELLRRVLHPRLLKQEKIHAMSKRPQIRCAAEADITIQQVVSSTQEVKANLIGLELQFQNLEGKVDKLELEFENGQKHHMIHQLSFSPGRLSIPLESTKYIAFLKKSILHSFMVLRCVTDGPI